MITRAAAVVLIALAFSGLIATGQPNVDAAKSPMPTPTVGPSPTMEREIVRIEMLHFIVTAAFIIHGLAHLSGFMASWTKNSAGFSNKPWVLSTGITLHNGIGHVFGLLWLVAAICSVSAGIGPAAQQPWWPGLAVTQAMVSLIVIVPWWNTVVPGAKVGAVFDVLVLIVLLLPWQGSVIAALQ